LGHRSLFLLGLGQGGGRQLYLFAAPGDDGQVGPNAQPVQLLAHEIPGAQLVGQVAPLNRLGYYIEVVNYLELSDWSPVVFRLSKNNWQSFINC
jgi:hypothetical protein